LDSAISPKPIKTRQMIRIGISLVFIPLNYFG